MATTHTQENDEYVGISEAARIAYLSVDTIRRYADKGILDVRRTPGNQRRFLRSDVERLLRREGSSTEAVAS